VRNAAMMMLATGKLCPAEHALSIGLINDIHVATKSADTLARSKRSFMGQAEMKVPDAYHFVQGEALANMAQPDAKEGIGAFLEKRPAIWRD
jgi:enoyl-CoA hydratase/carnithine racemase